MSTHRSRRLTTAVLVVGAVAFGMVLAGSLRLTPQSVSDPAGSMSATQAAIASGTARALPGFADLAEAVDPAVVSIQAATINKPQEGGRRGAPNQQRPQNPFEFFFPPRGDGGDGGDGGGDGGGRRQDSGGSGFVISADGLVVTNNHVIDGATSIRVHLGDRDYPAEVKGVDPLTDLALLKIDAGRSLRYLELGNSDRARVGDWVMVIGNPLNLDKTVTTGVISAKGRSIGINDTAFENFIQTDAAINFGNSGGPVVNLNGEVVAIATAINYGAENIGFCVPVNTLKEILPQLRDKGKVSRGYLGVQIQNLDYETAQSFGLDTTDGALVGEVEEGTPAERAGVKHGDIITHADGRLLRNTRELIDYIAGRGPNAKVELTILRDGKKITREVELGERPGQDQVASVEEPEGKRGIDWLGIDYRDLNDSLRQGNGLPKDASGVWITDVEVESPLYDEGVRAGDLIAEVNGRPVEDVKSFEQTVRGAKAGAYLRLYMLRYSGRGGDGRPFFAVVRVP